MSAERPLSPECRAVFWTAGPDTSAIPDLVREDLNWSRVVSLAQREKALSIVWRALEGSQDAVPAEAAEHMRRGAMVSDFRMLQLEQRLKQTLRVMRAKGVEVMLLKGAAVGATVYPAFCERPMVDVDMLIRRGTADAACQAMCEAGWQKTTDSTLTELLEGHHHLPPFIDPNQTGLKIELHTSIMPEDHPFVISDDDVWAGAGRAGDGYSNVAVPSPVHLLYHACVHFAWSHAMQFGSWRTFRDVNAIMHSSTLDWDAFVALAKRTRSATACYWTLRLARRMSAVPVPDQVLRELSAPSPELMRRAAERHFIVQMAPGEGPLSPSVSLSHQLWRTAIRPRWSGHGEAQPWTRSRNWDYRRTGAVPASLPRRFATQLGAARQWWHYLSGTLSRG